MFIYNHLNEKMNKNYVQYDGQTQIQSDTIIFLNLNIFP